LPDSGNSPPYQDHFPPRPPSGPPTPGAGPANSSLLSDSASPFIDNYPHSMIVMNSSCTIRVPADIVHIYSFLNIQGVDHGAEGWEVIIAHHLDISRLHVASRVPTSLFTGIIDGGLIVLLHSCAESTSTAADIVTQILYQLCYLALF
jgi:hypothetical protein